MLSNLIEKNDIHDSKMQLSLDLLGNGRFPSPPSVEVAVQSSVPNSPHAKAGNTEESFRNS